MPLISVIMPSYNSEKTIEYSVRSVLNQTFTDFELIIIDGSNDNTSQIIEAINDKRIKLIKMENQGVVTSYKKGIEKATGKYITFCDSDDMYNPDYLEQAVSDITNYDCDFVSYAYDLITEDFNYIESIKNTLPTGIYTKSEIAEKVMPNLVFNSFIRERMFIVLVLRWNKIYKKELVLKIIDDLDTNCYQIEDNVFTTLILLNTNSFYINNDYKCYKYVEKKNSISNGYRSSDTYERYMYSVNKIQNILNQYNYPGDYKQISFLAYDSARIVFRRAAKNSNYKTVKQLIKKIKNNNLINDVHYSDLEMMKNKLFFILMKVKFYLALYLIFKIL